MNSGYLLYLKVSFKMEFYYEIIQKDHTTVKHWNNKEFNIPVVYVSITRISEFVIFVTSLYI